MANSNANFIQLCSDHPGLIEFVVEAFSDKVCASNRLHSSPKSSPALNSTDFTLPELGHNFKSNVIRGSGLPCDVTMPPIFSDANSISVGKRDFSNATDSVRKTIDLGSNKKIGEDGISYAKAVTRADPVTYPVQDPSPQVFPTPESEGDFSSVTIPEQIYQKRVDLLKNSFLGRVSFKSDGKMVSAIALKSALHKVWGLSGSWRLTFLGKGFYNVFIVNPEERMRVFNRRVRNVEQGTFRLTNWGPDFNPYKINSSKAKVWLRIYELPFEYWDSTILWSIATSVGAPIKIDDCTLSGNFGHFARVLVEIDFKKDFVDKIMIKRKGFCTFAQLTIENAPEFCTHCGIVGHSWDRCRFRPDQVYEKPKEKKIWVTKVDSRVVKSVEPCNNNLELSTSNKFDGLREGVVESDCDEEMPELKDGKDLEDGRELVSVSKEDISSGKKDSMPHLMELEEQRNAIIGKENDGGLKKSDDLVSLREKERCRSLESFEKFLQESEVEPFTPTVQKAVVSAPCKMRPITLCARPEDSPARRALNMGSNLNIVSKEFSSAAAAMHMAATRDFTRLNSMKPP